LYLLKRTAVLICWLSATCLSQTNTSTVSGSVSDPSSQRIAAAQVLLTNQSTGDTRTAATNSAGEFVIPSVLAGIYKITVESKGFRSTELLDVVVTASERRVVGTIQLNLGAVTETVSVTAQAASLKTESAEGSAVLTSKQLGSISQPGRNVIGLLKLLPGVRTSNNDNASIFDGIGAGVPPIAGLSSSYQIMAVDGVNGQDATSIGTFTSPISLDAIEEVKIQLHNSQAEYASNGGSYINVITKSGTRQFHGSAYYYKRHEGLNANNFFNNRSSLPRPVARYNSIGAAIGGPVTIPKIFNTDRQRLFFFYNYETSPSNTPLAVARFTMPSALERKGDFSQTLDQNSRVIVIRDPQTGAPFPGNIIPANRINKNGLALLNLMPLPSVADRTISKGAYNYEFQRSAETDRDQHLFRIDYRATDNDSLFFRGTLWDYSAQTDPLAGWEITRRTSGYKNRTASLNYTRVLSPTMVNEFTAGVKRPLEFVPFIDLAKVQRAKVGFTAGQLFPYNNPFDIIPQATFGGLPNAPNFGTFDASRIPYDERDISLYFTESLTVTRGTHTAKAGIYFVKDRTIAGDGLGSNFMGALAFDVDSNNPFESNNPYSNAILGNFRSYTEPLRRVRPAGVSESFDWYVQDSWKATRRLTVELGIRAGFYTPWEQWDGLQAAFTASRYDPAKAPILYRPVLVNGTRLAVDPRTGLTAPATLIGAYTPNSGDYANGSVTARDATYPHAFVHNSGVLWQPRFGFAWDVFGNGRTAVRGGFGKFNQILRYAPGSLRPPLSYSPQIFYGNLDTFLSAANTVFPGSNNSTDINSKSPDTYNVTLGVQQRIGFGTALEVKYVSTLGRDLAMTRNINTVPYGARFLASNIDPTTNRTLPDVFLRPFSGIGDITYRESSGSSNYHSLQVVADRRFSSGLQFGIAYTYAKTLDYGSTFPLYRPYRVWNYALADFDQTHSFVFNFTYDLPKGTALVPENIMTKLLLDDWQASGIVTLASGPPAGINLTTTNSADLTGGGDGQRVNVIADPRIDHADRGLLRMFNTSAFALPAKGDPGNAPRNFLRNPGVTNGDLTIFKNIPLPGEGRRLQFRWEAFNVLNKTQFSAMDTTARFDPNGVQVNGSFGQATAARPPRTMQLSLRLTF